MNIVLVIGGVWLGLLIVAVVAFSVIGRRLNPHIPLPEDSEEADADPPDPGADPAPGADPGSDSGPGPGPGPGHPTG